MKKSDFNFNVRHATEEEFYSIIREPQLHAPILKELGGREPIYEKAICYLISIRAYRLLFTLKEKQDGLWEVHIACPRDSIRASRVLILAGVKWISLERKEIKGLITSCPEGKIANMCRKLGFTEIQKDIQKDKLYFILSLYNQFNEQDK